MAQRRPARSVQPRAVLAALEGRLHMDAHLQCEVDQPSSRPGAIWRTSPCTTRLRARGRLLTRPQTTKITGVSLPSCSHGWRHSSGASAWRRVAALTRAARASSSPVGSPCTTMSTSVPATRRRPQARQGAWHGGPGVTRPHALVSVQLDPVESTRQAPAAAPEAPTATERLAPQAMAPAQPEA